MFAYENEVYTLQEMKERKNIIESEEKMLNDKLKELKKQEDYQEIKNNILNKSLEVYNILIDKDIAIIDKQIALDKILDKIIYDKKNKQLTFYWKGAL